MTSLLQWSSEGLVGRSVYVENGLDAGRRRWWRSRALGSVIVSASGWGGGVQAADRPDWLALDGRREGRSMGTRRGERIFIVRRLGRRVVYAAWPPVCPGRRMS